MMKYLSLVIIALSTLMLSAGDALSASGAVTIDTPKEGTIYKTSSDFWVKGSFLVTEDSTKWLWVDEYLASLLMMDGEYPYPHAIGYVFDYTIGSVVPFSYPVHIAGLDPNVDHTVRIYLQDVYAGAEYPYDVAYGDIFAEKSFTLRICQDKDHDGYTDCDGDCNDNDPTIYPGAPELCDGKDHNCNGNKDDDCECKIDPDQCSDCPEGPTGGDPVSLLSGLEAITRTDLTIGSLYPITIERRYSSLSTYDSKLGYGWAFNYDKRLYTYTDGSVTVRKGCGWKRRFTLSGGNYITPADDSGTLVQNADGTYTWTQIGGAKEIYDAQGRLVRLVDAKGNSLALTYETAYRNPLIGLLPSNLDQFNPLIISYDYRISRIEEKDVSGAATGKWVEFHYDGITGRLNEIVDSATRSVAYGHDSIGNLISVAGSNGNATYGYNSAINKHYVTDINEGKGLYVNTFDTNGRVIRQDHAAGSILFDYVSPGTKTKVTTVVRDPSSTDLNTRTRTVEYDSKGKLAKDTDTFGHVTLFTRDGNSKVLREEHWENTGTVDAPNLTLKSATDYTYDAIGNVLTKTETSGSSVAKTMSYTYHPIFNGVTTESVMSVVNPAQNRVVTNVYNDTNGTLLNATETGLLGNGSPYSYTTTYTYDSNGKLKTVDGPRTDVNDVTTYNYDSATGFLISMVQPLIGTTTYSNFDGFGNPQTVTDPNSNSTTYTYDTNGRVSTVKAPGDTNVTQYFYLSGGCSSCGGGASNKIDHIILPEGNAINYSYDTLGNLSSIRDSLGNSINYTYDSEGNRLTEEIKDSAQVLQKILSYSYDALNRLYHITNPDASFTEYTYDFRGNKKSVKDPRNNTTSYAYDELGRLKTVNQPGSVDTLYGYDTNNNLTTVADANNNTTTYKYDDKGRVYQVISPDAGTTTYTYDPAGNLTSKADAKGVNIFYTYDAANRLTGIASDAVTGLPVYSTIYTYDTCLNGKGRLCTMTDASGTTSYEYSSKGQVTKETKVIDSQTYITQYTYDQNGNLKTMIYPSGKGIKYNYSNDRIASVVLNNAVNLATNIAYKPFGGMSAITYGNGLTSSTSYDTQYRLSSLATGTIQNLTYGYDNNGNITSIAPGKTYTYDALDRLGTASGPWGSLGWTYDGVGNRLTENANTYTYSPNTNKLTSANGINFGYDSNGNTTTQSSRVYTYNQNQRLIQVTDGAMTANYTQNGNGQRVKKNVNGTVTIFHYSLSGQIIAESNSAGTITAEYVYLNGQPLVKMEGANTYYYHNDHLGTPQRLTDSSGQIVWSADYKPFGEASVTVSTITNNLRLPGQYYDAETGLHQNWRRDYNFLGGRYIEADPIGLWAGINIYAYVRNNPLRFVDPLGLATLPGDPSGLPPNWTPDPTHLDPNGQKFVDPSGRPLYWHPGQPGKPGWGGKPHWHDPCNFGKKHLPPGANIPDPAPLPPPPVPWWKMLPALIPDPFPIIINPCIINPYGPGCYDGSA